MNNQLITKQWNDKTLTFREDGYFNMTMAAKAFGKDLSNFMRSPETKEYIAELSRAVKSTDLLIKVPGNRYIPDRGTWAHPELAVFFARWLDVRFALACDLMIKEILRGNVEVKQKEVLPAVRKAPVTGVENDDRIDRLERMVEKLVDAVTIMVHPMVTIESDPFITLREYEAAPSKTE
ncbi:KilA-N domain-containing protein [Halomonas heilongjiangensis]|uniref:KilA-N domain-containing protein n=1 Tax=Halomonas heilongjiangensis TaxID=1387883 RepID=A0A2N7TT75_9GAMM|nr:KilA-N domain-containing protein [Halomonas heilongjiangensis]PMR71365.1 hypothetical protein C1H66_02785 [Halomonas heilongjiangensis]PXX88636.1 hypothetical protein CR158_13850 [Halomonas heilongjiangensis]